MRPITMRLAVALLCLILGNAPATEAAFERLVVAGQPAAGNGEFDPSVQYDSDGTGYMAYSVVSAPFVSTVLAKSTDHGASWTFVQVLNLSETGVVSPGGSPVTGVWRHEVPTLIYDPADTGKPWKLYWHRYFTKAPYGEADRMFDYGWIGYKYAAHPEGAWSAETAMFGCSPFPRAPFSAAIDLRTLHPTLNKFLAFTEPGGLQAGSRMYLAMQGSSANPDDQTLFLISSPDHGTSWDFHGYLATSQEARDLGYTQWTAPALAREAGRSFLLMSPQNASYHQSGTFAVEIVDLQVAALARDGNYRLAPTLVLEPTLPTINSGEAAYHAGNSAGGILFPQAQLTPSLEFQIWNTHLPLLSPTPAATPTAEVTPSPSASPTATAPEPAIRIFPNPASQYACVRVRNANGPARFRLYNTAGERVRDLAVNATGGELVFRMDVIGLAPGVYYYRIHQESGADSSGKIAVAR